MPERADSSRPAGPEGEPSLDAAADDVPVRNVSPRGIGLLLGRPLDPGTLLGIALPGPDAPPTTVLATVVHATPRPGQVWLLGCRFAADLAATDLRRFEPRAGRLRWFDRRACARSSSEARVSVRPVRAKGVCRLSARPVQATAAEGVLVLPNPPDVGMVVEWEMPGGLTILASVVRVSGRDESRAVTCQFIRELSDRELDAARASSVGQRTGDDR